MQKVKLDIDLIPEALYQGLLDEFRKQHGEGYYDNWKITADKEPKEEGR